jgi:hypothetical protein
MSRTVATGPRYDTKRRPTRSIDLAMWATALAQADGFVRIDQLHSETKCCSYLLLKA